MSVFAPAVPENFQEPLEQKGEAAQIAAKLLNTNLQPLEKRGRGSVTTLFCHYTLDDLY